MTARDDVEQLAPLQMVEMFVFDDTGIGGTTVFRWTPGTAETGLPIVWQGVTYEPFPIQSDGFEMTQAGKLPRPTLAASNIGGALGAYFRSMSDALMAKVTRKRTFGKYLDAANFPSGNPYADPNAGFPDEIFYVAKKVSETPTQIEIELAVKFDVEGVMLPRRQVLADICQWVYRSAECSYAGPPVQDIYGNPTTDASKDQCRKTLDACRARFGKGVLRTSAFPASLAVRQ